MFELFPFLFNNFSGNNFNGNLNNTNNNTNNNNYQYSSYNNGSHRVDIFSGSFIGTFSNIFNDVFTSLINNEELMNTIIETIVSNDTINSIVDFEEDELKLEFRDYGDRYLIEGKIEGVTKEDIDVDYENEHISIKVKREALKNNDLAILMLDENKFIEKTFYVPKVDKNRIQAVYNANVLRIYLKKLPEIESGREIIDVSDYIDE